MKDLFIWKFCEHKDNKIADNVPVCIQNLDNIITQFIDCTNECKKCIDRCLDHRSLHYVFMFQIIDEIHWNEINQQLDIDSKKLATVWLSDGMWLCCHRNYSCPLQINHAVSEGK